MWNSIQLNTAFSRMLLLSSIRLLTMTCRTTPNPVQVGQAPAGLLNEKLAMPISAIAAPQCGQGYVPSGLSSDSSCQPSKEESNVGGGTSFPHSGQGRCPRRAYKTLR